MMKRIAVIAIALTAAVASLQISNAQDQNQPRRQWGQQGRFLADARTEDGRVDLAKLPEQLPQERKDAMKAADKDGDGFLSDEEMRALLPQGGPGQFGAPQGPQSWHGMFGGPQAPQGWPGMFGGPQPPQGGLGFFGEAFKDGKLDLSKLPERTPEQMKENLKKADKDGDGFLSTEELRDAMPRPEFRFPEGAKPDFINEKNAIVIEKAIDALKKADKNGDGVVDSAEQEEVSKSIRESRSMIPMVVNFFLNGVQPGMPGMRPNGGQPGMPAMGPNGGQPGMPGMGPNGGRPGQFGMGPMGEAFKDGKLDLSKLPEQTPEPMKENLKKADKDGDGFLAGDELRGAFPPFGQQAPRRPNDGNRPEGEGPRNRRQNPGAPQFNGPQGGPGVFGEAFKDGKLDLSKLPEKLPQERKDAMKAADKDGDGFLSAEEMRAMPRPKRQFPEGMKPAFLNDDDAIVIEKVEEIVKGIDADSDGALSAKEIADFFKEEKNRGSALVVRQLLGGQFGLHGMAPNGGQFGRGPMGGQPAQPAMGPNGNRQWQRGQQWPQGQRGQRGQQGPQGQRGQGRGPRAQQK